MGELVTITVSKKDYETFRFLTMTIARLQGEVPTTGMAHHSYHQALHHLRALREAQALTVIEGALQI